MIGIGIIAAIGVVVASFTLFVAYCLLSGAAFLFTRRRTRTRGETRRPSAQGGRPSEALPERTGGEATARRPRVVIVGAGFAGLECARALKRAPVQVTVVDRRNHHVFQPLLYQVATAGLNPADIAAPTRRILRRQKNAEVLLAEVRGVDVEARRVELDGGDALSYGYLRSRVAVLLQWAYHDATYEREARLITATAAAPLEGAPTANPSELARAS